MSRGSNEGRGETEARAFGYSNRSPSENDAATYSCLSACGIGDDEVIASDRSTQFASASETNNGTNLSVRALDEREIIVSSPSISSPNAGDHIIYSERLRVHHPPAVQAYKPRVSLSYGRHIESQSSKGAHNAPATHSAEAFVARAQRVLTATLRARHVLWEFHSVRATHSLKEALGKVDVTLGTPSPQSKTQGAETIYLLDRNKQHAFSTFLRRSRLPLPEFIRLLRGETPVDPRPNKALEVPSHLPHWYSYQYRHIWENIVRHGVRPRWCKPFTRQLGHPKNHGSALRALNVIVKSIRKGQDSNQYLVLDIDLLEQLEGVTCSPFGAVQKGQIDLSVDARVIHDLSFPPGESVNDNTVETAPVHVSYDGVKAIARRVLDCWRSPTPGETKMMTGDVHGAFRHIPIHANHAGRFAGTIPELGVLVVDLSCPFGWSESPACYWVAGCAINHIYSNTAPSWPLQPISARQCYDGKVWCDDHVPVEQDIGTRLAEADIALRNSMTAVLGSGACNEEKFSGWFSTGKALGLIWNTKDCTVSMAPEKIAKASQRIDDLKNKHYTTRTELQRLLGSLRHVATCVHAAAPFFQRVCALLRATPRYGRYPISPGCRDDLLWFSSIIHLAELQSIPLERFTFTQDPTVHIHMDASDFGLCALFPARKEFLQIQFDDTERHRIQNPGDNDATTLGINTRELMSAVYASLVWGNHWTPFQHGRQQHVRFWIDNTSAIAWNNRRSTRNELAQMLLRLLALREVHYNFYSTASHIPGEMNIMADAGSRVWQSKTYTDLFANLSRSWVQVVVPSKFRNLSELWAHYCVKQP